MATADAKNLAAYQAILVLILWMLNMRYIKSLNALNQHQNYNFLLHENTKRRFNSPTAR